MASSNHSKSKTKPREKDHEIEYYFCKCDSCEYWRTISDSQNRDLFLGIIIPLIWFNNFSKIIKALFFLNYKPKGETKYLEIRVRKFKPVVDEYNKKHSYLEHHRSDRNYMWECLGHILLAIVIYALFLFGFIMAFNKSSAIMIPTDQGFIL